MDTQTILERLPTAAQDATWELDPSTSWIGFSIGHMKFATVNGRFDHFTGTIRTETGLYGQPVIDACIDANSINTGIGKRDNHLRSADFLDVATYPTIEFHSTRVETAQLHQFDRWLVVGDLTLHGVTRPVKLAVERMGDEPNPWLTNDSSFVASTMIRRRDFGIGIGFPLEGTGIIIGDDITLSIEVKIFNPTGNNR
jgi:polyisoprenoid-binding protein YceI